MTGVLIGLLLAACGAPPPGEAPAEEDNPIEAMQEELEGAGSEESTGLASGEADPSMPTATPRIDIDSAPIEVDNPDQAYSPDFSGEQEELTAFEAGAQDAGLADYSGIVCRITFEGDCICSEDSATSEVAFSSANEGVWSLNLVSGSSVTFNIQRLGVDTWRGETTNEERTLLMDLVFFENGFQQTTTIEITDEQQVTCTNIWQR